VSEEEPRFVNADNKLIWQELRHIKELLPKLNGAVLMNTEHRHTSEERWRLHEKDHDVIGRNNIIASAISGVTATITSIFGGHVIK